jgi:hypothetical protein
MGQFNNKIMAEFNPPRKWTLGRELSYTTSELNVDEIKALQGVGVKVKRETNKTETITVPKGFVTDLASVPRAMWWLIAPFDVARAAIIHDLLYKVIRQYRWEHQKGIKNTEDEALVKAAKIASDKVFLLGMRDADPKIPGYKIYLSWKAVDLFGNGSIKPNKDNI